MEKQNRDFNPLDYPEISQLFGELLESLFDESGRGALLIATAHVDDHLTRLIEALVPEGLSKNHKDRLFKYPGPLSSFSSKIELAYVFRIINKNLYDNLNALRKIRNDAAHSASKFDLYELNEKIKSVYEIGPGFSDFIKEISNKALLQQKVEAVKNALATVELDAEAKNEILEKTFKDKAKLEIIERQVPFWELVYGLSFLCGLIVYHKENIKKLTSGIQILGELLKHKEDDGDRKTNR